MKIEYREATESELKFGAVDRLIDLVEIESCDLLKDSIGVEPEATGRGNEDCVIVAHDMDNEGSVAGIVVLRNFLDMREPLCTLDDLYVKEKYRRMGIGTGLVRKAISMAREQGKKVILSVIVHNCLGVNFWESVGDFLVPATCNFVVNYDKYDIYTDNEDKFTPGPWNAPDGGNLSGDVVAKDGEMVCDPSGAGRHEDEMDANAGLIAAAPEMHKLLRRIESYFKNRHIYGPGVEESVSKKLMIRIERVMKKADGKICERE